jgi:hypothetical protein
VDLTLDKVQQDLVLEHLAQQTLVAAVEAASSADRISRQVQAAQEPASLGIGVKHGALCKN